MARVITINRPDVVALVEEAAERLTEGNKTEAVALALRRLLERERRTGSLFGRHPGSVRVREGVDLTEPALDVTPDAESGKEIDR
ncbi:MAG TPA: type II toxin-antitoxin system VapB family antitoxin [Stellaceae bacterium]|nr:type II toxin-antitoxin system VapB family antitoxin [Stellaceae bacterium]